MLNIAVMVSGGGTNLQAIMDRIADGSLPDVRIACVIASRPGIYAQTRAERGNIPCQVIRRSDFRELADYDNALIAALAGRDVGLVVLAGFLNLLGPGFIAAYRNKIINIHPALIPAFCGEGLYGIRPHEAALAYGVRITGATVHFVDEHYDRGPIILQKAVEVRQDDTPQSLQKRVMQEAEQVILPQAIALFAAGRIRLDGRKTIIEGEIS